MTEKFKAELFKVVDEYIDTILRLDCFIVVIDEDMGVEEHLICVDRGDLDWEEINLDDAYAIVDTIDKKYTLKSSDYSVNLPRTYAMYKNLNKISEQIHNTNEMLDQINYISRKSGGKIDSNSIYFSNSSDPIILLRTLYNCHKYFTIN